MRIGITGASGFIGLSIVRAALERGYTVRVLTRKSNIPQLADLSDQIKIFNGDFFTHQNFGSFVNGLDAVINAAGEYAHSSRMAAVNLDGPQALYKFAQNAGVRRWIQISSVGAYGRVPGGIITESNVDSPQGEYELTKSAFDQWLLNQRGRGEMSCTILRPSIVFGEGMPNKSLQALIGTIKRGQFFYIGKTGAIVNYIHVADVAAAVLACLHSAVASHKTYILSDCLPLEEFVQSISRGARVAPPGLRIPKSLAIALAFAFQWHHRWPLTTQRVQALSNRTRYVADLIAKDLGWRVRSSLSDSIEKYARLVAGANTD
jgi:nucleoside-diphosphate-sugar epimerase